MMFLQIAAIAITSVSPAVSPVSSSNPVVLPEAPIAVSQIKIQDKKHTFNKLDYALYAGVAAYRVGDYFTTERGLTHGAHEAELPAALVASKPAFAGYCIGMAGLEIVGSVYLHKHGHAKLARVVDAISIGAGVATDANNFIQVK